MDPTPKVERRIGTPAGVGSEGRLFVIGASHMCWTEEFLPDNAVVLADPGFHPEWTAIERVVRQLDELKIQENDCVVLDLLSNAAFMGTTAEGLPAAAERHVDGKYHIVGSLIAASPSLVRKELDICMCGTSCCCRACHGVTAAVASLGGGVAGEADKDSG
jgi:hypothetical protein